MKTINISIEKSRIHALVEAFSYKLSSSALAQSAVEVKDNLAADVEERLDAGIIDALAETRVAHLCTKLIFCLERHSVPSTEEGSYEFVFHTERCFNDNYIQPLTIKIRDYIYKGVLFDWYDANGLQNYGAKLLPEIDALESDIEMTLRKKSLPQPIEVIYASHKIR